MSTRKKSLAGDISPRKSWKGERKNEVLARLLQASWMVDAGWTRKQIADHYQTDRNQRAKVKSARIVKCKRCRRVFCCCS